LKLVELRLNPKAGQKNASNPNTVFVLRVLWEVVGRAWNSQTLFGNFFLRGRVGNERVCKRMGGFSISPQTPVTAKILNTPNDRMVQVL